MLPRTMRTTRPVLSAASLGGPAPARSWHRHSQASSNPSCPSTHLRRKLATPRPLRQRFRLSLWRALRAELAAAGKRFKGTVVVIRTRHRLQPDEGDGRRVASWLIAGPRRTAWGQPRRSLDVRTAGYANVPEMSLGGAWLSRSSVKRSTAAEE
jgi:hypothetical protein